MQRLGSWCCRNQTIFGHDGNQLRTIWQAASIDHRTYVSKVLSTDIGRLDYQGASGFTVRIAELMN